MILYMGVDNMKKNRFISLFLTFVCIMNLSISMASATTRASDQITAYFMDTIVTKDAVNVEFSITGKVIMKKLGCESIYLYRKSGSAWVYEDSRTENDTGMSNTKKINHGNTITLDGRAGVEYMVVVTVFAEDDSARDTRSKTFYVTGK